MDLCGCANQTHLEFIPFRKFRKWKGIGDIENQILSFGTTRAFLALGPPEHPGCVLWDIKEQKFFLKKKKEDRERDDGLAMAFTSA